MIYKSVPGIAWLGEGISFMFFMPTGFLWGALILSMLIAITQDTSAKSGPTGAILADD